MSSEKDKWVRHNSGFAWAMKYHLLGGGCLFSYTTEQASLEECEMWEQVFAKSRPAPGETFDETKHRPNFMKCTIRDGVTGALLATFDGSYVIGVERYLIRSPEVSQEEILKLQKEVLTKAAECDHNDGDEWKRGNDEP